jgi:predicted dehydrogenase
MAPHGFAVVGAGLWGGQHARVLSTLPEADLVAVCDVDASRAEAMRTRFGARHAYTDLTELLANPEIEAVTVATPDVAHSAIILAALAAGKHVMSEKPLATDLAETERVVAAARQSGRLLMLDFHNRVNPPVAALREAIAAGELGRVIHGSLRLSNTTFVPREMLSWAGRSSALWFLGSHAVDALRFVTGDEVVRVQAVRRDGYLKGLGVDTADVHLAILQLRSGLVVTLENSWVLPPDSPMVFDFRMELVGEKGAVQVSTADNGAFRKFTGAGLRATDLFGSVPAGPGRIGGFVYEAIARFVDAVVSGGPVLATAEDGLAATRILAAIEQAAATGTTVELGS